MTGPSSLPGEAAEPGGGKALRRIALALSGLVLAAYAWIILVVPGISEQGQLVNRVELAKSAAVTLVMFWAAWSMRRRSPRLTGAWLAFAAAYLCYTLGDAFWVLFNVTLTGGMASVFLNAFYLLFYPLFLLGVLRLPRQAASRGERWKLILELGIVMLAAGMVLWNVLLRPVAGGGEADLLRTLIASAYPAGDLALLWAFLALVFKRREAGPLAWLLAGSASVLIATDVAYSLQVVMQDARLALWISLGYTVSQLLAGLAAVEQIAAGRGAVERAEEGPKAAEQGNLTLYLAYLCLAVAWVVLVGTHFQELPRLSAAVVLVIIVLVLARQVIGIRENVVLNRKLAAARDELEIKVHERTLELGMAVNELQSEVAERQSAEAALQESEERFRSLVQNSHDILTVHEPDGTIVYETPSASRILGYGPGGLVGRNPFDLVHPDDLPILRDAFSRIITKTDLGIPREYRFRRADGGWVDLETLGVNLLENPSIRGIVMTTRDVTERKQAQQALGASEERFRGLVQNSYDIITIHDAKGIIRFESPSLSRILGYEAGALTGESPMAYIHPEDRQMVEKALGNVLANTNTGVPTVYRFRRGDGTWAHLESVGNNMLDHPAIMGIVLTSRDVTERKVAEAEIRRKLKELTVLNAVATIAVEAPDEATLISQATDEIRTALFPDNCGVLLVDHEEGVLRHASSYHSRDPRLRVAFIPLGKGITGGVAATGVARRVADTSADPDYIALDPQMKSEICVPLRVGDRVIGVIDAESRQKDAFTANDEQLLSTLASQIATSIERYRSAEAVRVNEARYRAYIASSPMGVLVADLESRILEVNDAACAMTGFTREELLRFTLRDLLAPESAGQAMDGFRTAAAMGSVSHEVQILTRDLMKRYWWVEGVAVGEAQTIAFCMDITEQKWAEEARQESEERFRRLSEAAFEGIGISEEGRVIDANSRLAEMTGYDLGEVLGKRSIDLVAPESREAVQAHVNAGSEEPYEYVALRKDGSRFFAEARGRALPYEGRLVRVSAVRDVTENKLARERIHRQLRRLAALRAIDTAITSSMDLRVTLAVFLEHAVEQLGVDAAGVLLLHPSTQTLEYAAGRGFRTEALRHTRLGLGECYAGRAALQRKVFRVSDLADAPDGFTRSSLLMSEGFRTYYAAPFIAKGQVKGVLEIFHRERLDPDQEWLDFLETLVGQAAIALDNMSLFESMQRSNVELQLAYDITLEGWSKALELRDQETEGHTRRVTELTMRLARAVGMREEDLVHVRRGAILHDIGKMGIPDNILLKEGPLTEEEWVVMRKHADYAFSLLSPIEFLREALEIPYCHHERWDGTGYPRGLKGEQIPLSARVFSVVDCFDALSYERPYRPAWPRQRVMALIRDYSGTHYDPRIVDAFFKLEI